MKTQKLPFYLINLLRHFAVYTPNTPVLRGIIPDQQTREPVGLSGGRLAEAVKALQSLISTNEFIEEAFNDILSLIDWINAFDTTSNVNTLLSSAIARPKNVQKSLADKTNRVFDPFGKQMGRLINRSKAPPQAFAIVKINKRAKDAKAFTTSKRLGTNFALETCP
jgi:hypothetical protein